MNENLVPIPKLPPNGAGENQVIRMLEDLRRALAKPTAERRWGMVIDLRKCVGCQGCTVACITENKLPPGVVYRPVVTQEHGTYPNVAKTFLPRPCMQCEKPPCVSVCPVNATFKRPDGIVAVDYEDCIGCRYCMTACPYQARVFDFGGFHDEGDGIQPYEQIASREYGRSWNRNGKASPIGNVRKCTFCLHRLEVGELPTCTISCMGRATYFGDLNDPKSLIAQLVAQPNVARMRAELGAGPQVFYLM